MFVSSLPVTRVLERLEGVLSLIPEQAGQREGAENDACSGRSAFEANFSFGEASLNWHNLSVLLAVLPISSHSDGESGSEEGEIPCAGFVPGEAGSEATGAEAPVSPIVSPHSDGESSAEEGETS